MVEVAPVEKVAPYGCVHAPWQGEVLIRRSVILHLAASGARKRKKESFMFKLAFAIPGLALTAAIFWAMGRADLWTSTMAVIADPWGVVMLIDLYAGFIITGLIIAAIERWKPWAFAMVIVSFALGNVVFAVWAVLRGASELRRLAVR
jgi:hypothetical protein